MSDTFERVKNCIASSLGVREESIAPSVRLSDLIQRHCESLPDESAALRGSVVAGYSPETLSIVELVLCLDEEFCLEIPDAGASLEQARNLLFDTNTTVQQIVEFIEGLR